MSIGKNITTKFEDNSKVVTSNFESKKIKILYAIGLKWLEICTKTITQKGIVDTGRLRASLSFITPSQSGSNGAKSSGDSISGRSGKDSIIVGSNVRYASKQELTNRKGSFLSPSILEHKEDYKKITEAILKE